MSLTWHHAMTSWRHGVMMQIVGNVCHQLEVLKVFFSSDSLILLVDKCNTITIVFVTCTVDLVGQGRLTTTLTISISAIRGARKMIIFLFPTFFGCTSSMKSKLASSCAPLTLLVMVAWPLYWPFLFQSLGVLESWFFSSFPTFLSRRVQWNQY